jgi:hypothetical protein
MIGAVAITIVPVAVVRLIVEVAVRVAVVALMVVVVVVKAVELKRVQVPFATSVGEKVQLYGVQDARAYGESLSQHYITQ